MSESNKTEALLLVAPGCPHCPTQMTHLTTLLKEGRISRLEITDIQKYPEVAARHNVRSVPWLKLGEFTLTGVHSLDELRKLSDQAVIPGMRQDYLAQRLASGELDEVTQEIRQHPQWLASLLPLLASDDTEMQVRLGIDSIMESMAGSEALQSCVTALGELTQSVHLSRLADIIYYLGLSHSTQAIPYIETFQQHDNPDIVEASHDALNEINQARTRA